MIKFKPLFFTALGLVAMLMLSGFHGQIHAADKTTETQQEKVRITSDSMMFDEANSQVEFTGNVVATRLDATIHADHVKVILYSEAEKKDRKSTGTTAPGADNIKQLIASGNVQVDQNDGRATADKAVYTPKEQTIILTGSAPTVVSANSRVTGKKITLYQDTRRVVVESEGTERVEAFFDSGDTGSTPVETKKK